MACATAPFLFVLEVMERPWVTLVAAPAATSRVGSRRLGHRRAGDLAGRRPGRSQLGPCGYDACPPQTLAVSKTAQARAPYELARGISCGAFCSRDCRRHARDADPAADQLAVRRLVWRLRRNRRLYGHDERGQVGHGDVQHHRGGLAADGRR